MEEKAFVIETPKGIETYIGTKRKIKTYVKEYKILEEMSVESWQIIEKIRHRNVNK